MNINEFNVSDGTCVDQNLEHQCIDPRSRILSMIITLISLQRQLMELYSCGVVDESIKARLAFNNAFDWLATALVNALDGKKNGMHGANMYYWSCLGAIN